jgi:hypothetical protein
MSESAEVGEAAPSGSQTRRRLISAFIGAFLLYQTKESTP